MIYENQAMERDESPAAMLRRLQASGRVYEMRSQAIDEADEALCRAGVLGEEGRARAGAADAARDAAAVALDASELRRQLSEAHECLLAVTRAVLSTCEIVLPSTSTASIAVDVLEGDAGFDGLVVPPRTQSEVSQPTLLDKVLSLVSLERRTKAISVASLVRASSQVRESYVSIEDRKSSVVSPPPRYTSTLGEEKPKPGKIGIKWKLVAPPPPPPERPGQEAPQPTAKTQFFHVFGGW